MNRDLLSRPSHNSLVGVTITAAPYIRKKKSFGDPCDGGTPGYISNPVVKPVSADGTWSADSWESRSLPKDFFCFNPPAAQALGEEAWGIQWLDAPRLFFV